VKLGRFITMFLSLRHKRNIFNSFPELTEKISKNGMVGYDYEGSRHRKKEIARELSYTGNGYIYVGYLVAYTHEMDDRGFLNISNFSETELRQIISKVIESFK
jgi:hypothetical protein